MKNFKGKQPELISEKTLDPTKTKKQYKTLSDKLKAIGKEMDPPEQQSARKANRTKSKLYKYSGSLDDSLNSLYKNTASRTMFLNKSLDENHKQKMKYINEINAAIKIQSYFRMYLQRKLFLKIINRKVLKYITRRIDNVEYVISAILNSDNDIIIEATPLAAGIPVPTGYFINKSQHKEFGIENLNYISNLLA